MQSPPLDLSIVIVSWNAKALLLECLESIAANPPSRSFETIVVDNASTDGSPEAVLEKFPYVRCIQNPSNLGFAKANNIGIRESSGRYVCFVNSDVKVLNSCFDALCNYMDGHPQVGIIGPRILWPDLTLQNSCRHFPSLWNNLCVVLGLNKLFPSSRVFSGEHMEYSPHDRLDRVDSLVGCFLLVRREVFDKIGLFDEEFFIYSEEVDLCRRAATLGFDIIFFPSASAIHYGRGSSSNAPLRFTLEQKWSTLQYWKKHHGSVSLVAFSLIYFLGHSMRILGTYSKYLIGFSRKDETFIGIRKHLFSIGIMLAFLSNHHKDTYIHSRLNTA